MIELTYDDVALLMFLLDCKNDSALREVLQRIIDQKIKELGGEDES